MKTDHSEIKVDVEQGPRDEKLGAKPEHLAIVKIAKTFSYEFGLTLEVI